ncbi:OLC1v1037115C1 [Oldenlandia corymbosa var. corymbosa]|uniref:OLC1v1037115C1 n=1 Tax=Oldenlandia corymbosa var. corymbosa TaxID=529605 RepID=A0AAV1CXP0_OLDCO|nr:OLC1v1037115C1 [Oldenlandia corymbosa var. corymbosa]
MEMEAILLLLEIFDRVGDKIVAYLQVINEVPLKEFGFHAELDMVREISWLLKDAGFDAEPSLWDESTKSPLIFHPDMYIVLWEAAVVLVRPRQIMVPSSIHIVLEVAVWVLP